MCVLLANKNWGNILNEWHILTHCWTEHRLLPTSNPLAEICYVFFNICVPFPFQNKENWKCLITSTNVWVLCLDFDEVSAILQALHLFALLSRSSREMKFNSSWYVKAGRVYVAFVKTMLDFFLQTTHFIKSRAHSPRPTSKIIGMIALRHAILMKADLLVSLHAHRLFSGRACSCFLKQSLRDFLFYVILAIPYLRARTKETSSLPNDSMRPLFKQLETFSGMPTVYFNCKYFP